MNYDEIVLYLTQHDIQLIEDGKVIIGACCKASHMENSMIKIALRDLLTNEIYKSFWIEIPEQRKWKLWLNKICKFLRRK